MKITKELEMKVCNILNGGLLTISAKQIKIKRFRRRGASPTHGENTDNCCFAQHFQNQPKVRETQLVTLFNFLKQYPRETAK